MRYHVNPTAPTSGELRVPGDKSISHRALMFSAIAAGESMIRGLLMGEDCLATLAALRSMGVSIEQERATYDSATFRVHGVGRDGLRAPQGELDLGNSGTAMRLFAGLLSGQAFSSRLVGDASLSGRPMGRVIRPLQEMGAQIDSLDGCPPLDIRGGLSLAGIDYVLPVASAQVKSAVLLAGLYASDTTTITEPATTRDHTERMLATMGVDLRVEGHRVSLAGNQSLTGQPIDVPGDLSSAAFPMLAAILAPSCELCIRGVGVNPTRTGVIDILKAMGADISIEPRPPMGREPVADLHVRSSALRAIDLDPAQVSLAIDEFPVLFAAAAAAQGVSRFRGLKELRVKESDRISAMADGLRALGIAVDEVEDGADIDGGTLSGGVVDSRGDHRIAMAFSVAATRASGPVTILDTAAVDTSFPGFVSLLASVGCDLSVDDGTQRSAC